MAVGLTPREALRRSRASTFLMALMTVFTPSERLLVSEQLSAMKSHVCGCSFLPNSEFLNLAAREAEKQSAREQTSCLIPQLSAVLARSLAAADRRFWIVHSLHPTAIRRSSA